MSKAFDLQGPTADEKFGECESVRYFTASFKFSLACTYSVVVYLRARVCTHTYNIIAQYLFLNTPHLSKPRLHPLPMIFVPSGVQMLIAWHHAGLPEKPLQIAHSYLYDFVECMMMVLVLPCIAVNLWHDLPDLCVG